MRIFLILALLSTQGCAKSDVYVDPQLQPYFDHFAQETGADVGEVSAEMADDLAPTTGGNCNSGTKKIRINAGIWKHLSLASREFVMYHELGHCALNLQHNNFMLFSGCPASIMFPNDFGNSYCYIANRAFYIHQLSGRN